MRLVSMRIHNFKSIADSGLIKLSENDNTTILAGQNESGKSAILQALGFFESGASENFEEYFRRIQTSPRVECYFKFTKEEVNKLEKESGSKELTEFFKKNTVGLVRGDTNQDDFETIKYFEGVELKEIMSKTKPSVAEGEPEGKPYNLYEFLLNNRPKFILYDSFHENILPSKITRNAIETNRAVKDFESVFKVNFTDLLDEPNDAVRVKSIKTINDDASDNLNTYWKQKIGDVESEYKYQIDVHPQTANPTESYVNFFIDQGDGFPLHVGQRSQGFQWFSSFNLRLRAHEATLENLDELILLIDEPGQGLHEQAQKDVKKVLDELASNGSQIIFSTHQAQLLGGENIEFPRLRLVSRNTSKGTKVKTITQMSSESGAKDALAPIRTALGMVTLNLPVDIKKHTTVTEGITDYYYIRAFLILTNNTEVHIIPCVGVDQAPNVYSILYGWGVAAKVIVDDDRQGRAAVAKIQKNFFAGMTEKQISKYILINTGCEGIEDTFSRNDFKKISSEFVKGKQAENTSNSKHVKNSKEIVARSFFEKVNTNQIKITDLDKETISRLKTIVSFVK